jgi:hypothetical protein
MRVLIEAGLMMLAFYAGRGYQAIKDTVAIRRRFLGDGKNRRR